MFKPLSIFLLILYGLSWGWAATEPSKAFIFLLIIGLLASIPEMIRGLMKFLFIAILMSVLSALAAIFWPLWILVILLTIGFLAQKMEAIVRNIILIIIGVFMYGILYFAPAHLYSLLLPYLNVSLDFCLVFAAGVLTLIFVSLLLKEARFPEEKAIQHVVGFPAFIFLLLLLVDGGDTNGDS